MTLEHKKHISEGLRLAYIEGRKKVPINFTMKGKKHSEWAKKKMSKSHIGKKLSEENKDRIGDAMRGKHWKMSEQGKKNISESHKGNPKLGGYSFPMGHRINLGRKLSAETRKKMGLFHKGKPSPTKGMKFSEECRRKNSEAHKGENCHFWKGGITPINAKVRMGIEFRLWREAVFARDNWTCQKCEERGGKLHPHHIQNFAQWSELRFAIDNGIVFCRNCHNRFHKIYGIRDNTKKQIEEFLTI